MKAWTNGAVSRTAAGGVAALVLAALAGCAGTPRVAVPQPLVPPAGESLAMIVAAKGVQIYECRPAKGPGGGHEWVFVAPEAELFDVRGKAIGRHGAGPIWQAADGSSIVGTVKARADAPLPGAIPWLLLDAKTRGPDGTFAGVKSIQRVNTVGGAPPDTPCGTATGGKARVDYTADYHFFESR